MNEQEQHWLERARAGDQAAFGLLVEMYQRPIFTLTYRMLGHVTEAEDAAQETFLRAYARLHQYDPQRKFSTWIFSIAHYHCIDRLRKRRVQIIGIDESPVIFSLESETARPEENVLAAEQAEEVQALVNQLEPDYRTPLILRYWNDCSYQEIAEIMNISVAAVKSRLFRARKKLASLHETAQQTINRVEPSPAIPSDESAVRFNLSEQERGRRPAPSAPVATPPSTEGTSRSLSPPHAAFASSAGR